MWTNVSQSASWHNLFGKQFAIILWRWEFGCPPTQQCHMWVYVPQEPLCTRLKRVQGNVSSRGVYISKRPERTRMSSVVNRYTDGGVFTPRKGLQLWKWQTAARCNNEISSTQRTLRAEGGEATRGQLAVSAGDVRSSGDSRRQSHRAFQDERKRTWWQISNEDCQGSVLGLRLINLVEWYHPLRDAHRRAWKKHTQWKFREGGEISHARRRRCPRDVRKDHAYDETSAKALRQAYIRCDQEHQGDWGLPGSRKTGEEAGSLATVSLQGGLGRFHPPVFSGSSPHTRNPRLRGTDRSSPSNVRSYFCKWIITSEFISTLLISPSGNLSYYL